MDFENKVNDWNIESCKRLAGSYTNEEIEEMRDYLYKYCGYEYEDLTDEEIKLAVIIDYTVEGLVEAARDRNPAHFYKALENYIRICL